MPVLLWLLGVPIVVILALYVFHILYKKGLAGRVKAAHFKRVRPRRRTFLRATERLG